MSSGGAAPAEHPEWLRRLEQAREEVLPWIEEAVPLAGLTVLEYGCGQGAVSCAVAPRCGRHVGFDIDPEAVAMAQAHARRRGIDTTSLHAVPVDRIAGEVRAHAGEVDVFLLYAVLEHLSVEERLEILALAREVTRPDGHIVIAETPNRLTPVDHHTAQLPFFHALPPALAARHRGRSPRPDFVAAIDAADAAGGEDAVAEALVRWGTGMSFHELELVFDDLAAHTVASSYHARLYPGRPVRWEELQLSAFLGAWRPDLPPCWSRSWLDTVLSARPAATAPVHVRPWALRLEHDVAGAAMRPDALLELRPGARLPVRLPAVTDEVHVGLLAGDAAGALRIHLPDGSALAPAAAPSHFGVPAWHATATLPAPVDAVELELVGGGCVSFVGYRGPAEAPVQDRLRSW